MSRCCLVHTELGVFLGYSENNAMSFWSKQGEGFGIHMAPVFETKKAAMDAIYSAHGPNAFIMDKLVTFDLPSGYGYFHDYADILVLKRAGVTEEMLGNMLANTAAQAHKFAKMNNLRLH